MYIFLFSQYFPSTTLVFITSNFSAPGQSFSNSNFLMSPTFPIFPCISLHIVTKMLMWHLFRISKFRDWILENVTSWEVVISWFKSRQTKIICWKVILIHKSSLFSVGRGFPGSKQQACCFAEDREWRLFWWPSRGGWRSVSDAKAPEAGSPKQPTFEVRGPGHWGHLRTDLIYRM